MPLMKNARSTLIAIAKYIGSFAWAFTCLCCLVSSVHATSIYDFELLNQGSLHGQDGWRSIVGGNQTVSLGSGVNGTKVAGNGSGFGTLSRINNANYNFPHFSGTETAAITQFDLTLTSGVGTGGEVFRLGHDASGNGLIDQANEIGPGVGVTAPGSRFGFYLHLAGGTGEIVSPLGNYGTMDDWIQIQLVMNFVSGMGTVQFRNLSRGQTTFTVVPRMQNVNLTLASGPAPSTWDAMRLQNDHFGQADNLIPNLSTIPVPEPSSVIVAVLPCFLIAMTRYFKRARMPVREHRKRPSM